MRHRACSITSGAAAARLLALQADAPIQKNLSDDSENVNPGRLV
jgi:hypothetical protein